VFQHGGHTPVSIVPRLVGSGLNGWRIQRRRFHTHTVLQWRHQIKFIGTVP